MHSDNPIKNKPDNIKQFKIVYDDLCVGTLESDDLYTLVAKLRAELQEAYFFTGLPTKIVIDSEYYVSIDSKGVLDHGYLLNI